MTTSHKILALIPARSGSKGLSDKNKKNLLNKPLFLHSSDAAQKSRYPLTITVSTNDPEIAELTKANGLELIHRPDHLSLDSTVMNEVIEHALSTVSVSYDILLLLQPTSPQRTAHDIDTCLDGLLEKKGQSVISVYQNKHHPLKSFLGEKNALKPLRKKSDIMTPRQHLPKVWQTNGAIFCLWVKDFLQEKSLFIDPIWGYEMPYERSIDIDHAIDLKQAEDYLMAQNQS